MSNTENGSNNSAERGQADAQFNRLMKAVEADVPKIYFNTFVNGQGPGILLSP